MKEKAKAPEKEMGKGEARIQANGVRRQRKMGGRENAGKRDESAGEKKKKEGRDENAGIAQGG